MTFVILFIVAKVINYETWCIGFFTVPRSADRR